MRSHTIVPVNGVVYGREELDLLLEHVEELLYYTTVILTARAIGYADMIDEIIEGLPFVADAIHSYQEQSTGSMLLFPPPYDKGAIERHNSNVPKSVLSMLKGTETIDEILIAHELLKKIGDEKIRGFILLGLGGAISDLARRRGGEFLVILRDRLHDLYLRIYIFHKLNQTLKIKLGSSKTYVADTRDQSGLQIGPVDAIVNSPPYSTVLDYIKNDYHQLALLELANIAELETRMIGNPNLRAYPTSLLEEMKNESTFYSRLPADAKEVISALRKYGRIKEALRAYKFFKDMCQALREMNRVMKDGAKCAIVIGNNHYKLDRSPNIFLIRPD